MSHSVIHSFHRHTPFSFFDTATSHSLLPYFFFFHLPYTLHAMRSLTIYSSVLFLLLAPTALATLVCGDNKYSADGKGPSIIVIDLRFQRNKNSDRVGPKQCTPNVYYDPWSKENAPKVRYTQTVGGIGAYMIGIYIDHSKNQDSRGRQATTEDQGDGRGEIHLRSSRSTLNPCFVKCKKKSDARNRSFRW